MLDHAVTIALGLIGGSFTACGCFFPFQVIIDVLFNKEEVVWSGLAVLSVYFGAFLAVPIIIYRLSHNLTAVYIAYALAICCLLKIIVSKYREFKFNGTIKNMENMANVVEDDGAINRVPTLSDPASAQSEMDSPEGIERKCTHYHICITIPDNHEQKNLINGFIRQQIGQSDIPDKISTVCLKYYSS